MTASLQPLSIFVQPGDHCFADYGARLSTVIEEAVAMTVWHPQLLIGGLCHYSHTAAVLLLEEIGFIGAGQQEYQVKLFGSGAKSAIADMPESGLQAARLLLKQYGFANASEYCSEERHYSVVFDVWSGEVRVRHCNPRLLAEPQAIKWSLP